MNRTVRAGVSIAALAGVALGTAGTATASGEPVNLTFSTYAFQEPTIAATEEIVAAWNEANPDIQVELVMTSAENVHDQLVTQFAGGTAPDIIHDESADILGFAEQGYLADLAPYFSEELIGSVSEGDLVERDDPRWGDHRRPDAAAVLRRVRQRRRLRGRRRGGPDR